MTIFQELNFLRSVSTLVRIAFLTLVILEGKSQTIDDSLFVSFVTTPSKVDLFWKDEQGNVLKSISNLQAFVKRRGGEVTFAMNGGMYKRDNSPQGLFIQNSTVVTPLDTLPGKGNFYLNPNGVFYITKDGEAVVCTTSQFEMNNNIRVATQSGPMLIIEGKTHPAFIKESSNLNIRNGVGILPDGNIIFAMSKQEVNFYDFAMFFREKGCKNALYLDGFVSRMYLPEKNWMQTDGNFGVMIGVIRK